MSSIKKNYHTIYDRRPVDRDTARACSGEDKDFECKIKIIETVKTPPKSSWTGMIQCPICRNNILSKNMPQHVLRHKLKEKAQTHSNLEIKV